MTWLYHIVVYTLYRTWQSHDVKSNIDYFGNVGSGHYWKSGFESPALQACWIAKLSWRCFVQSLRARQIIDLNTFQGEVFLHCMILYAHGSMPIDMTLASNIAELIRPWFAARKEWPKSGAMQCSKQWKLRESLQRYTEYTWWDWWEKECKL